jgi:hypothetical protein
MTSDLKNAHQQHAADLFPSNQHSIAVNALIGDEHYQRRVLELAVRLADAEVDPIEIFKRAALYSLRVALERNKLPSPPDKRKKGSSGDEFLLAIAYEKAVLMGRKSPAKFVMADFSVTYPAINRARKRHGDLSGGANLAKERALFELAMGDSSGPDLAWWPKWEEYRQWLYTVLDAEVERLLPEHAEYVRTRPRG